MIDDRESKNDFAYAKKINERISKYPSDMTFHRLRWHDKSKLKTPWLLSYLDFRLLNPQAETYQLLDFLKNSGADSSLLADRSRGAILGLMIGDALGMPLEFSERDKVTVSGFTAGGVFNLDAGYWTDDSSMAFCTAYSLCKCKGFNASHLMQSYYYWYKYGAYSSKYECFDIGNTTRQAIENYSLTGNPYSGNSNPDAAGNGSLMRMAPIAIFYANDFDKTIKFSVENSKLTHRAIEAIDACRFFASLLYAALNGESKEKILSGLYSPYPEYWEKHPLVPAVQKIAMGSYKNKSRDQISSSGYVVNTLEAALWAFNGSDDFRSGALAAVNLADDADTVGAVFGQLAGAFYGETNIPFEWITNVHQMQAPYHFAQELLSLSIKL